ncbi:IcfG protein, partial [Xanthomonas phaseoli]|nr:IcfG protein [Xanthomonas phaseoli]
MRMRLPGKVVRGSKAAIIQRSCCHQECAMRNRPRSLPQHTSVAARMPWRRSLRMRVLLAATAVLVALLAVLGTV